MELKHNTDRQELTNKLLQSTHLLKAQTETWKQNYLITTPIDGKVSFTTYWSKNQNVKSGELIFSVVPIDSMTTKARLQFPIQNSGKIKEGQQVNIKLQNYPYQEFGMLVGHLSKISEVPNELLYSADVVLDKGLITSYGKRLPKVQQLKGDAEILTDDLSLLMRFFNPLRAIFDHRLRKHNQ
ncbi:HlyD family secretion protein [Bacteroides fragilis]|uniref:HlyD family secretion protein n=1 Tax=Bacteroides fragilis TaxID=817 RepID=UPI003313DE68